MPSFLQNGILAAIAEAKSGKVTPHHEVMARLRKKYTTKGEATSKSLE